MTTERDPQTRTVLSWLREDTHENAERVLLLALDEVDATPQRRSWWPAWRSNRMNTYAKLIVAAAAVLVFAVVGYQFLPRSGGVGVQPTTAPSPSPALLASGNFTMKGAEVELNASRGGSSVTGVWHVNDSGPSWTGDLECARTTPSGLIVIGGDVTDSTSEYAKEGARAAIVLKRGSPVQAYPHFEPDPPSATCLEFLETVTDADAASHLDPITGSIEFGP